MLPEILTYGFMQKAYISGIVIAIACSLLGVFLVLRKYALIGDGLAHISFGGIAVGMLANIMPFFTALIFAIISSLGIIKLREKAKINGDSAIGIISHASLGLGIFIISISHGFNVDILSYLFGNILVISNTEVIMSIVLAIIVIGTIIFYYNDLFYLTFDEQTAKTSGIKTNYLSSLLIVLTAITIVSSMRIVGLMLASSLIVLPAASALQIGKSFKTTLVISAIIAVLSVVSGITLAYIMDYAVSGTIVLISFIAFLVCFGIKKSRQ